MKKFLAFIICIAICVCSFTACSGGKDNGENPNKAIGPSGSEITTIHRDKKHTTTNSQIKTTQPENKVNTSKISPAQAIGLMESYSDKELGITKEDRTLCTFMVSGTGEKIDGEDYIVIDVSKKIAHIDEDNGATTYTFDKKGEYLLHYNGKKLYKKDLKTNKLSEMKLKEIPKE